MFVCMKCIEKRSSCSRRRNIGLEIYRLYTEARKVEPSLFPWPDLCCKPCGCVQGWRLGVVSGFNVSGRGQYANRVIGCVVKKICDGESQLVIRVPSHVYLCVRGMYIEH
jgi:hypothetical protein